MYQLFQKKVKKIAESYADVIDKRIQTATKEDEIDSTVMMEINDGIRLLNHISATLQKIEYLNRGNGTGIHE